MTDRKKRSQIMIDQPVQGALLLRVTIYWLFCQLSVLLSSAIWSAFSDSNWSFEKWAVATVPSFLPGFLGSLLFLPFIWADILRVSNRFVGPASAIRNAIRRLLSKDPIPELRTRSKDFWQDTIQQFNELRKQVR